MKNIFTLTFLFALHLPVFSQADLSITHEDFGDGLIIQMGENLAFDLNDDGSNDFSLNSQPGVIDFTPSSGIGCFASNGEYSNIGSQVVSQFSENDFIAINNSNLFEYIDYEPGITFMTGNGLAEDWIDLQETYVGFAVFSGNTVSNGWMKLAIDVTNQGMILLRS